MRPGFFAFTMRVAYYATPTRVLTSRPRGKWFSCLSPGEVAFSGKTASARTPRPHRRKQPPLPPLARAVRERPLQSRLRTVIPAINPDRGGGVEKPLAGRSGYHRRGRILCGPALSPSQYGSHDMSDIYVRPANLCETKRRGGHMCPPDPGTGFFNSPSSLAFDP